MLTRKQEGFGCSYLTDLVVRYLAFGRGLFTLWTCKLCVLLLGRVSIRSRRTMLKKIKSNEILPAKISLLFCSQNWKFRSFWLKFTLYVKEKNIDEKNFLYFFRKKLKKKWGIFLPKMAQPRALLAFF